MCYSASPTSSAVVYWWCQRLTPGKSPSSSSAHWLLVSRNFAYDSGCWLLTNVLTAIWHITHSKKSVLICRQSLSKISWEESVSFIIKQYWLLQSKYLYKLLKQTTEHITKEKNKQLQQKDISISTNLLDWRAMPCSASLCSRSSEERANLSVWTLASHSLHSSSRTCGRMAPGT